MRNLSPKFLWPAALLVFGLAFSLHAAPLSTLISRDELISMANELAPKVNLFRAVWRQDPAAEFFGGTSRDFLYWLKGRFRGAETREEVQRRFEKLKNLPVIDVRDFITGESDVDILSDHGIRLKAEDYGVRKIDVIDRGRLDPTTPMGKTERDQGYIPVEKIRLGSRGLIDWKDFGDGIGEVLTGKLTVHYVPRAKFDETHYAKIGRNHPSLLALRYLRLLAANHYYEHGRGYPKPGDFSNIPNESEAETLRILEESLRDPKLRPLLKDPTFSSKMNETVQKAFRTYTSPTAAFALYKRFGADRLVAMHEQLQPINQYLFAKYRDPEEIEDHLAEYGVDKKHFFMDQRQAFRDGKLYHGTKSESAFRAILQVGILPSESGNAESGLYGVPESDIDFAAAWGGDPDRVVTFGVKDGAKIVDITDGEGRKIFRAFQRKHGGGEDAFAEYFGIDILRYPYGNVRAFVVKNSEVLSAPQGHTRQILTVGQFLEKAPKIADEAALFDFLRSLELNNFTTLEKMLILDASPYFKQLESSATSGSEVSLLLYAFELSGVPFEKRIARLHGLESPWLKERLAKLDALFAGSSPDDRAVDEVRCLDLETALDYLQKTASLHPPPSAEWSAADTWANERLRRVTIQLRGEHHNVKEAVPVETLPTARAMAEMIDSPARKFHADRILSGLKQQRAVLQKELTDLHARTMTSFTVGSVLPLVLGIGGGVFLDHGMSRELYFNTFPFLTFGGTAMGAWVSHLFGKGMREEYLIGRNQLTRHNSWGRYGEVHDLDLKELFAMDKLLRTTLAQHGERSTVRAPRTGPADLCNWIFRFLLGGR